MSCCCLLVRHAVSRKKRRTVDFTVRGGGVDLDLIQVHRHIVCMGLPAMGFESCYRNRYVDVVSYLDHKYGENYMVFNLCDEPGYRYNLNLFYGRVREYPFPDHWACPLEMISTFVTDAVAYITQRGVCSNNVVAIHCKAGKGRTGLLTCCLLMEIESSLKGSACEAIEYYGLRRTSDGCGLTIPSQIRYVEYYEVLRSQYNGQVPQNVPIIDILSFEIFGIEAKVSLTSCKWYAGGKNCVIRLKSYKGDDFTVSKSARHVTEVNLTHHSFFKGFSHDVRVEFLHGKKIVGALMFHTLFLQKNYSYTVLDGICKLNLPMDAGIHLEFILSSVEL